MAATSRCISSLEKTFGFEVCWRPKKPHAFHFAKKYPEQKIGQHVYYKHVVSEPSSIQKAKGRRLLLEDMFSENVRFFWKSSKSSKPSTIFNKKRKTQHPPQKHPTSNIILKVITFQPRYHLMVIHVLDKHLLRRRTFGVKMAWNLESRGLFFFSGPSSVGLLFVCYSYDQEIRDNPPKYLQNEVYRI